MKASYKETASNNNITKEQQDLLREINRLKHTRNAVVLAHYYQEECIQEAGDYIGDSLGLSRKAADTEADIIVFAGVHFMAETAKIVNPEKKVLLPDTEAGCSLADSCTFENLEFFRQLNPEYQIVSYINCSAEVKALSDVICTSSNAVDIVNALPRHRPILFVPDRNLGNYVKEKSDRSDIQVWNGDCTVHTTFALDKILGLKSEHPDAAIIAHPECVPVVQRNAHFVGSTTQLIKYARQSGYQEFIVVTESGVIHQMQKECPDKTFLSAPPIYETACECAECPFMKMNTLQKVYDCLYNEAPEINLKNYIIREAYKPIKKMLELS